MIWQVPERHGPNEDVSHSLPLSATSPVHCNGSPGIGIGDSDWHVPQPPPHDVLTGAGSPMQPSGEQWSFTVHSLKSSQLPPLVRGVPMHRPSEHMSFWV